MLRARWLVIVVAMGCGKPNQAATDGGATDSTATDATDPHDADPVDGPDANPDLMMSPLTPEPQDLSSAPCSGILGFPGLPAVYAHNPRSFAVDVDGDALVDLVFFDSQGYRIAKGRGDGTFHPPYEPFSVVPGGHHAVADVSGDGFPDIVVGSTPASTNNIKVFINDGMGGFGAPQTLSATIVIKDLAVADLNGDGRRDLVVLASDGDFAILRNTASGFSAAEIQVWETGTTEYFSVGDITGDDRPEIVTSSTSPGRINIALNNGSGSFAQRTSYPITGSPGPTVLADMNNDGTLDIVAGISRPTGVEVDVSISSGNGVLGATTAYAVELNAGSVYSIAAGDVDGDGNQDIGVVANSNAGTVNVLRGSAAGQLTSPLRVETDDTPWEVLFSDLNRDGKADLVYALSSAAVPVLSKDIAALFETRASYQMLSSDAVRDSWMFLLDGDARPDLIALNDASPSSLSTGLATTGTFAPPVTQPVGIFARFPERSDVNNDGRLDLVMVSYPSSRTMLNLGDGTFAQGPLFPVADPGVQRLLRDLDGDGVRDLIIAARNPSTYDSIVRWYRGFGDGEFAAPTAIWSGRYVHDVAALDLNGDAALDLVIVSDAYVRDILIASGSGTFATPIRSTVEETEHLAVRDLNGDGRLDLIAFESDNIAVSLRDANGTFLAPLLSPVSPGRSIQPDPVFADFNGDGALDIAGIRRWSSGSPYSAVLLWIGRGDGTFEAPLTYPLARTLLSQVSLSAGDVDGDGRLDLVTNGRGDRVSVMHGRCL